MPKLPIIRDLRGDVITPIDLPPPDTIRWTPNKKYIVVCAVRGGLISLEDALKRYHMEEKELSIWEKGFKDDGVTGLKSTHFQRRRQAKKQREAEQT